MHLLPKFHVSERHGGNKPKRQQVGIAVPCRKREPRNLEGPSGLSLVPASQARRLKELLVMLSAVRRILGYDPQISFDEGLRRTVEWFRTH